ncbi:MAG TPA: helix-turn-helix domain-containing protein [Bdellovibrionota bacterium]|jgi:cytoskeleton protein RodZ
MEPMQETNESLGNYLRRSRESKNVSVEQVAYATRISLKMLRALEEDDHTALPAPTFVRGYLQAYAKYVRIDTQDLLLRYQHHLATAPDSKRGAIRSHYLYVRERYQEKRRLVFVIVLFAIMLSVAGAYFFLKAQREKRKLLAKTAEQIQKSEEQKPPTLPEPVAATKATTPPAAEKKSEKLSEPTPPAPEKKAEKPAEPVAPPPPPVVEKAPEPKPAEAKAPVVTSAPSDQKKAFNLLLRASEDVWFRYQTDEEEVKDLTLRSGKALMLRADKVIKIFSGNLNALKGNMNGKDISALATAKGAKSAVLPEAEAPNYKLPLFPQFQPKQAVNKPDAAQNSNENSSPSSARP